MAPEAFWALIALVIYAVVVVGVSYFSSRKENESDFLIGSRKVGILGTVASLIAGFRDGTGLVFWVFAAAVMGFGGMWFAIGTSLAMLLLAIKAPQIRKLAKEKNFLTVGNLISDRAGPLTAKIASIFILIFSLLYSTAQLFVSGQIFSKIFGFDFVLTTFAVAVIVGFYLTIGGYKTLIKTDIIQWVVVMMILALPFAIGINLEALTPISDLIHVDPKMGTALFLMGFLSFIAMPEVWQRIFSARDNKTISRAFKISSLIYIFFLAGTILFGISVFQITGGNPETAFFDFFTTPDLPAWLTATLGVFTAAVIMSTLDTQIFISSSTIAKEFLPQRDEKSLQKIIKFLIPITLLVLTVVAISIGDIIEFLFSMASLLLILAPLLIAFSFFKIGSNSRLDRALLVCLLVSGAVYFWMFFEGMFAELPLTMIPPAIFTVLFIPAILIFKTPRKSLS